MQLQATHARRMELHIAATQRVLQYHRGSFNKKFVTVPKGLWCKGLRYVEEGEFFYIINFFIAVGLHRGLGAKAGLGALHISELMLVYD